MPSKEERARRKTLTDAMVQQRLREAESSLPISKRQAKELFDHVDVRLVDGCDHTLRYSIEFIQERGLPEAQVIAWLNEYGGYCDCEVIANVEDAWGESVGSI